MRAASLYLSIASMETLPATMRCYFRLYCYCILLTSSTVSSLHVYPLNFRAYHPLVPSRTASRDKHHLKGTSSILHATQNTPFIHPAASTLRDAAFWVYVRQCLYNATISQKPLDLDFSLQLQPTPEEMQYDSHPLAWLSLETAWANQILWNTASVANFCFSDTKTPNELLPRAQQWQALWDKNQSWVTSRPSVFDPIGSGPAEDGHVFPDIWFTADWHGKSTQNYAVFCTD